MKPGPPVDVLLYHDIYETAEKTCALSNPRYTTALPKLMRHLNYLADHGLVCMRLGEWVEARAQGLSWHGRRAILTFDGPHMGWFKYLIPVLRRLEQPATFFVSAGWIEGDGHPYPESRGLRWSDIGGIERFHDTKGRQLFDIGCHSMWHTLLHKEGNESEDYYQRRLEEEIVEASHLIRKRTGCPVKTYAPPKGIGSVDLLRPFFAKAGIDAVRWAMLPGRTNAYNDDLYTLQISYCDTAEQPDEALEDVLRRESYNLFNRVKKRLISRFRLARE